jgi:hypothetical protein
VTDSNRSEVDVEGYTYMTIDTSEWKPGVGPIPGPNDQPEVVELAEMLPRVEALAAFVNSAQCNDHDRERLGDLVAPFTYHSLLNNLADLRSKFARDVRRATRSSDQLVIDWTTFFDGYADEPGSTDHPAEPRR